jgi:WD40 repeat protein
LYPVAKPAILASCDLSNARPNLSTALFTIRAAARIAAWVFYVALATISAAPARDLSAMSGEEITVLQQRLTDAGCYTGAIDGKASEALAAAKAACPDQEPVLRIETGMHVAQIGRIGVDAQCQLAATASDDRTVRLWSLPDGMLLRTLRPPIDSGNGGKNYAVAMSPNGRFVAAGGWDAHYEIDNKFAVSIFDSASGALIARVGAFEDGINHLAFSRDGRWLAATLGSAGLRVIEATNWREVAADKDYSAQSNGAVFGSDGRLYTVALDGQLRRYGPGPDFKREMAVPTRGGKWPFSVSIDPAGEKIAVGFLDSTAVDLYAAPGLAFQAPADTRGFDKGNLPSVAWSGDGKVLLAGGWFDQGGLRHFQLFDREGQRLGGEPPPLAANSIMNLMPCGDGFAVAAADPAFGLVDGSDRKVLWRSGVSIDMRNKVADAFTITKDAKRVRFGLGYGGETPEVFDVLRGTLEVAVKSSGLMPPLIKGLPIANWQSQSKTTFAGKPIALNTLEVARSLAIRPSRHGFVLGADWSLRGFDAHGAEVWSVPVPSVTYGVNVSPDDRVVVAAYGDGTIRWHRVDNGRELLALFVNRETKAWVAWTPTGYYMASPGGEDMIGWHVNRGWAQAADFFPASRFRDRFNRPDIVKLVLDTLDEDEAVKQANAKAHRVEDTTPLITRLPPLIRIPDPPDVGHVATPEAKLDYVWRSPSRLPVDRIDVLIDGRPVKEIALPVRLAGANAEVQGTIKFAMPPRDVEVGLIAWSGDIASEAARVKLTWTGVPAPKPQGRKLHALIAGVSDYATPDMALAYAAKDAQDFAHALEGQKGGYYAEVETRVLVDRQVTRENLIDGLDWLSKQPNGLEDVSVLFLAGHGLTDEKLAYWFLPADATEDQAHSRGLSQDDVRRALTNVPGKVVWFLDTCHAGGASKRSPVDVNTLLNTITSAENGGIVAFASSTGSEVSIESSAWKNGAFTKALVEGVEQGKAAFGGDAITTSLLDAYLEKRVKELTDDDQHPVMNRPPQEPDFTLALAKKP